ncbi:MAG: sigma-70 family RNA polymerase sigma factor [Oscillospiraceae bacterium]|nr:sigma-70 family RNA polymerase sigma factor [Oscillospiraceae bacterium]
MDNKKETKAAKIAESSAHTGDSAEEIIKKYSNMVYRLALSQMKTAFAADDIFQEVFLRYIRKNPSFTSEEHQKAWFLRVTINCCKSARSSAQKKQTIPIDESLSQMTSEQNDLLRELRKLPQKLLTVIHLYYYEDMSINEISVIIKKSPSAVKMRLVRGRERLKELMEEEDYV